MKNLKTWIHNFENLDPEQQIEVAKAIVDILERKYYWESETKEEKDKIVEFLRKFLQGVSQRKNIDNYESLLTRFNGLTRENKDKAIASIIDTIKSYIRRDEHEANEKICEKEGHDFGKWDSRSWTEKAVVWDAGPQGTVDATVIEWFRTCKRCGYIEKSQTEPEEARIERQEIERIARIHNLEKELEKINSEITDLKNKGKAK